MASPKRMNFRKSSKRGGGGHFQSKNLCCRFWTLNRAFSAWKWYKRVFLGYVFNQFNGNTMLNWCTTCISWEIGSYNTQHSRHTEHTHFCRNFVAKSATWFSENEGGGQRPFGTFPKNHQFWRRHPSLISWQEFLIIDTKPGFLTTKSLPVSIFDRFGQEASVPHGCKELKGKH